MTDVSFVTSRALSIDGFTYTISVYRKPSGFFAFWECRWCSEQSGPIVPGETKEAAMQKCERLINQHHADRHQPAATV